MDKNINVSPSSSVATSGVYALTNELNEKIYIGATSNIETAWQRLSSKLDSGEHRNIRLQDDWIEYGGNAFTFEVIETFDDYDIDRLRESRAYYIESHKADDRKYGYNGKSRLKSSQQAPDKPEEVDTHRELLGWLSMCDTEIKTSEDRLKVIESMQNDDILLDWVSSPQFKNKQVKTKRDGLTEQDRSLKVLDEISHWLADPDRDEWGILSKNAREYKGKPPKADAKGKRNSFLRVLSFSDLERVNKEGETYYAHDLEMRSSLFNGNAVADKDINILRHIDLSNSGHVMELLRMSEQLAYILQQNDEYSEIWLLLELLEDMIDGAKLDELDLYIIRFLKEQKTYEDKKGYFKEKSYNYKEIFQLVAEKYPSCNYHKAVYRINSIPNKLTKAYQKLETDARKIKESIKLESTRKQRLSKEEIKELWIDKEAQMANKEREKRYIEYDKFIAKNQPIHTEFWTREQIDEHLAVYKHKMDMWELTKKSYATGRVSYLIVFN